MEVIILRGKEEIRLIGSDFVIADGEFQAMNIAGEKFAVEAREQGSYDKAKFLVIACWQLKTEEIIRMIETLRQGLSKEST